MAALTNRLAGWWLLALGAAGAALAAGRRAGPDMGRLLADHAVHAAPPLPRPELHATYVDPVFKTRVTRITDPAQITDRKLTRLRHYYSKMGPWNAGETRALFTASDGGTWLFDTATWRPLKGLKVRSSDPEIHWHPTDPNLFYYLEFADRSPNVRAMMLYDVSNDAPTLLRDFSEYETVRGMLEGNMDVAGRYYAMVGKKGDKLQAFVFDVTTKTVSRRIDVTPKVIGDWLSVTPSGKYVVLMGADRSRVYDIQMNHLLDLPPGSFGHADLCTTADGRDVMVYDGADHQLDQNRNLNLADLATGRVSILTRIGWGTTPHVSCRNTLLPGWALISTQGPDKKYPNHDFEIFWVKLDGSGEVRRVAHHRSSREAGGYFAEQHAVPNRHGDKIIFASNWGRGGEISDYLVELPRRE
jgi:hypothetical protein